uniref:Spermatogenesis-associated protein 17 isoform X2 n=1 Tax=Petromyzon marinus TaxID=7757 RepID=A0AAJ7WMU3_PETMA|nr:spermatogenesis-associated protein 17 isoform X2 [Petromyzon marinus]
METRVSTHNDAAMAAPGAMDATLAALYRRHRVAEEQRDLEHRAAVRLQAHLRGCRVRANLRYLHENATVIQRHWRGYGDRKVFRAIVKEAVLKMKLAFFNAMAVKIQKIWRGYYVRKYVHNYYALRNYLDGLAIKHEIIRNELDEYAAVQSQDRQFLALQTAEQQSDYQARKTHYLLSTHQIAGIYNSPFLPCPMEMEYRLLQARPLSHRKPLAMMEESAGMEKSTLTPHPPRTLPPICAPKPQGPFKDPAVVWRQRQKPLEPSVRVATPFVCLEEAPKVLRREEWRKHATDTQFLPAVSAHKNRKYEPLLHTSSDYGHIPYGSKHFRDEQPNKIISNKAYQTVFPPIPIFEKLGKTYSQGQEV